MDCSRPGRAQQTTGAERRGVSALSDFFDFSWHSLELSFCTFGVPTVPTRDHLGHKSTTILFQGRHDITHISPIYHPKSACNRRYMTKLSFPGPHGPNGPNGPGSCCALKPKWRPTWRKSSDSQMVGPAAKLDPGEILGIKSDKTAWENTMKNNGMFHHEKQYGHGKTDENSISSWHLWRIFKDIPGIYHDGGFFRANHWGFAQNQKIHQDIKIKLSGQRHSAGNLRSKETTCAYEPPSITFMCWYYTPHISKDLKGETSLFWSVDAKIWLQIAKKFGVLSRSMTHRVFPAASRLWLVLSRARKARQLLLPLESFWTS